MEGWVAGLGGRFTEREELCWDGVIEKEGEQSGGSSSSVFHDAAVLLLHSSSSSSLPCSPPVQLLAVSSLLLSCSRCSNKTLQRTRPRSNRAPYIEMNEAARSTTNVEVLKKSSTPDCH